MRNVKKPEVRQASKPETTRIKNVFTRTTRIMGIMAAMLALTMEVFAQNAILPGTILPLQLNSSLNPKKSKAGQAVTARVMQDVPLRSGGRIRAGSKAIGRVLDVSEASNGMGARVSLRFDTLEVSKRRIPMTTNLRALASMMDGDDAQIPKSGLDRGAPEDAWTTVQIGGNVVYRGGGPVANGLEVVGTPTTNGVLVQATSKPGTPCRGDIGSGRLQALWIFSADACGTYGFADLTIAHAGRSDPIGQITLTAENKNIDVRAGSGLLLRVR
jgi:hypothetical protein